MQLDQLKRREFISLLGGAAVTWPLQVHAQQPDRMRRVGVLMNGPATDAELQSHVAAFVHGLRQLGWVEGQNLRLDIRWNAGDAALAQTYAAQLIGLMPDVILAATTVNLEVVRRATSTVPVVFVRISDPVEQGFVASITKPGGNLTGFSAFEFSVGGKWVDLLKEIAPNLTRVAVMFNPDTSPQSKFFMRSVEAVASSYGMKAIAAPVHTTTEIEAALQNFSREPNGGLILSTDSFTRLRSKLVAELAERHRLPSISAFNDFVKDGGLMYYGVLINVPDHFRQAASYVDRILKGEKPGDLPVQAPTKYELVINLKTAKRLGLTVPLPLTGLADEVIE